MNSQMLQRIFNQMDPAEMQQVLSQIDMAKVFNMVFPHLEQELEPHFEEIRDKAQTSDYEAAADAYASMSEEEQQEVFEQTVADVAMTLRMIREEPEDGLARTKSRLRDPDVIEPLLLILDEEDRDDMRNIMTWMGASGIPEMYTDMEHEQIERTLRGDD